MNTAHPWREAEAHLSAVDPVMARLIAERGPCTLGPDDDLFGSLCDSIIGQQISPKAADSIARRFRALFPGGHPVPGRLAELDQELLRSAGLSPQKQRYLKDLAAKCQDGTIRLASLRDLPAAEIERELLAVQGIGPWTVTMFLIFALNRPDVLPVGDLGLRKGAQLAYGLPELPGPAELRRLAQAWHPYATIASWYLWRALDNK